MSNDNKPEEYSFIRTNHYNPKSFLPALMLKEGLKYTHFNVFVLCCIIKRTSSSLMKYLLNDCGSV